MVDSYIFEKKGFSFYARALFLDLKLIIDNAGLYQFNSEVKRGSTGG